MTLVESATSTAADLARPEGAEHVVVFRCDKIGDLVVTSGVFESFKAKPGTRVTLVCSPYNRDVLRGHPFIDRILVLDRKAGWRAVFGFLRALRALRPTACLVMSPGVLTLLLARLSGARGRAAMIMSYRPLARLLAPLLLTAWETVDRKRLDRAIEPHFHQAAVAQRLAARLGFSAPGSGLRVPVQPEAAAWAQALLAGQGRAPGQACILFHLGGSWRSCGLSPEEAAGLVGRLRAAFPQALLVMTAGPADGAYLDHVSAAFPEVVSEAPRITAGQGGLLCSGLSLDRWNALLAAATLVITPDTGAVHLASAHRVPLVVAYASWKMNRMMSLFGPRDVPHVALSKAGVPSMPEAILGGAERLLAEMLPRLARPESLPRKSGTTAEEMEDAAENIGIAAEETSRKRMKRENFSPKDD